MSDHDEERLYAIGKSGRPASTYYWGRDLPGFAAGLAPGSYHVEELTGPANLDPEHLAARDWGTVEVDDRGRWHLRSLPGIEPAVDLRGE